MKASHFKIWMSEPGDWWWQHLAGERCNGTTHGPYATFTQATKAASTDYDLGKK